MSDIIVKFKPVGEKALIQAIKSLDRATGKAAKTGGLFDTSGKRNAKTMGILGNSFSTVRSKMLLFNFAMALGVRQVAEFMQEAANLEAMDTAFTTLSGGVDNASVAIEKLRGATNNTVSDFDLFQQANSAMVLGVTKNSDEMAQMFDMAQRLGRALGVDTKKSVESLITGIGRQSRLMLDNIGIIVKSEEAYKRYADDLGISSDQLTDTQKKQAFMSATLEAGNKKLNSLGKEVLSTTDAYDALGASIKNLTTRTGEILNEGFTPLIEAATDFVNAIGPKTISNIAQALISLAGAIAFVKTAQMALVARTKIMIYWQAAAAVSATGLSGAFIKLAAAIYTMLGPVGLAVGALTAIGVGIAKYSGFLSAGTEESDKFVDAAEDIQEGIDDLDAGNATGELDKFYQKLIDGNNLLQLANQALRSNMVDAFKGAQTNFSSFQSDLQANADGLESQIQANEDKIDKANKEFFDKFGVDPTVENAIIDGLALFTDEINGITGKQKQEYINAANELGVFTSDLISKTDKLKSDLGKIKVDINPFDEESFKEITNISTDFFDKYIKGSNIMQAVNDGTIKTNEDLIAVIKAESSELGFLDAATIKAIVNKRKLNEETVFLTDKQKLSIRAYERLKDAQAGTIKSRIAVLNADIKLLEANEEVLDSQGKRIKLTDKEIEQIQLLKDERDALTKELQKASAEEIRIAKLQASVRAEAAQMALQTFNMVTQALSDNIAKREAEVLEHLKTTTSYQMADEEQRKRMEKEATAEFLKEKKLIFRMEQASSLASIYMNTSKAMMQAAAAFPLTAGQPWAGIIAAMGLVQAGTVLAQSPPKAQYGGYIAGNRHSEGGTLIEAERGEFIMSRNAVKSIGLEQLNSMNRTGDAGGTINVNVSGNVMTQDFVEGELAESIKEAVRRGSDFGVS